MLPTPSHLRHRLRSIFLLAAADCLLLNGGVLAAGQLFSNANGGDLMAGGLTGAIVAMLIGIRLLLALPFDITWQPLALSAAAVVIPVVATAGFAYNLWVSVAFGIAGGGAFCLLGLHSYFTTMVRPRSTASQTGA